MAHIAANFTYRHSAKIMLLVGYGIIVLLNFSFGTRLPRIADIRSHFMPWASSCFLAFSNLSGRSSRLITKTL